MNIKEWTAEDVAAYITACDGSLAHVGDAFVEEDLDGRATLRLDDEDLKTVAPKLKER